MCISSEIHFVLIRFELQRIEENSLDLLPSVLRVVYTSFDSVSRVYL